MYLLHTTNLTLHRFDGTDIPPYAILSHRWDAEEVLFQDLQAGRGASMSGYAKIQGCCAQAAKDGWTYAWIDSCCIDKTSSAELSEAINSMFNWYAGAVICYAYLRDVEAEDRTSAESTKNDFIESQWFTRGWTLQELLAPQSIIFFDREWGELGTRSSLSSLISQITYIRDLDSWKNASVAQKMSWAAHRETTRAEDMAYCLMGLFSVHMPLLYGEGGENAFIRLQLEIMKNSTDESILVWDCWSESFSDVLWEGMLAPSPKLFKDCWNVKSISQGAAGFMRSRSFNMTNRGLNINATLYEIDAGGAHILCEKDSRLSKMDFRRFLNFDEYTYWLSQLNCVLEDQQIYLLFRSRKSEGFIGQFQRFNRCWILRNSSTEVLFDKGVINWIYVPQTISGYTAPSTQWHMFEAISISFVNLAQHEIQVFLAPRRWSTIQGLPAFQPNRLVISYRDLYFNSHHGDIGLTDHHGDRLFVILRLREPIFGSRSGSSSPLVKLAIVTPPSNKESDAHLSNSNSDANTGHGTNTEVLKDDADEEEDDDEDDDEEDEKPPEAETETSSEIPTDLPSVDEMLDRGELKLSDRAWMQFPSSKKAITAKVKPTFNREILMWIVDVEIEAHGEDWTPRILG